MTLLSDLGMGITLDNDNNHANSVTEDCDNDIAILSHDEHYAPYPNKTVCFSVSIPLLKVKIHSDPSS